MSTGCRRDTGRRDGLHGLAGGAGPMSPFGESAGEPGTSRLVGPWS